VVLPCGHRNHFCWFEALSCLFHFSNLPTTLLYFRASSCLSVLDTETFLTGFNNFLWPSQLARSCSADIEIELDDSFSVEHCIEWGDFVNIHFVDLTNFCYSLHCVLGQEVGILFLSQMKQGYNGRTFPVWWVLASDLVNFLVILLCEI
jgi:hypothetical protein